jgi:hypothetical protein
MPGQEALLMQWIDSPSMEDLDVVDVLGAQTKNGHHVIVYATTDAEPVGTTRPWKDSDQLGVRTLGGFGAEGVSSIKLPPGVVYRRAKGRAMVANVHYINTSSEPTVGRAYIDMKLVPSSPSAKVAAMLLNADPSAAAPPHQTTTDEVSCKVQHDVGLFLWFNHMHTLGASELSGVTRSGGDEVVLKNDDTWQPEWEFNPPSVKWPIDAPFTLKAGDTLHSQCTWKNPGASTVSFPSEMCVGVGLFLGAADVNCIAGAWVE